MKAAVAISTVPGPRPSATSSASGRLAWAGLASAAVVLVRPDSDIANTSGSSASASVPPPMKMPRQPTDCISAAVMAPPATAPMGKPRNMRETVALRWSGCACSAASAEMVGIAPPRPIPERKRHSISCSGLADVALSRMKPPATRIEASSSRRLPKRSAAAPTVSAPTTAPAKLTANTLPKAPGGMPHSLEMSGATKDSISVS